MIQTFSLLGIPRVSQVPRRLVSVAAQGIFGQGIFIDPKRHLVIASNADWTRATKGPEPDAREAFYTQIQALIDAEAEGGSRLPR